MRKSTTYRFRVAFRAPLPFVFRWCTDYSTEDPTIEGEDYQRRVLERTRRRVVFEDLSNTPTGWSWSRNVVSLHPPTRWQARMEGNHRIWSAEYALRDVGDGTTELRFLGKRTPTALGPPNPPVRQFRREILGGWARFARQLERDYRKTRHGGRRPGRPRRR